jgi:hypothetical protein
MLYSLKQIPQEIIDRANNQEPDPCYVCNAPILTQIFNKNLALVLLPCGHIHHDKCIKNLTYGSRCPFPYCTEIIENAGSILANMQAQEQYVIFFLIMSSQIFLFKLNCNIFIIVGKG